jgi:hypothetical protein
MNKADFLIFIIITIVYTFNRDISYSKGQMLDKTENFLNLFYIENIVSSITFNESLTLKS